MPLLLATATVSVAQSLDDDPNGPNTGAANMRAVCQGGTAQVWGANESGQLGLGYVSTSVPQPTVIPGLTNVLDVVWGNSHAVALLSDGTVRTWGRNSYGQLGLGAGNTPNYSTPQVVNISCVVAVYAGTDYTIVLKADGSLWSWGNNTNGTLGVGNTISSGVPQQVLLANPVVRVACGPVHCLRAHQWNHDGLES